MISIIILEASITIAMLVYFLYLVQQKSKQQKLAALAILERMQKDKADKVERISGYLQHTLKLPATQVTEKVKILLQQENLLLQTIVQLTALELTAALQVYNGLQELLAKYYQEGSVAVRAQSQPVGASPLSAVITPASVVAPAVAGVPPVAEVEPTVAEAPPVAAVEPAVAGVPPVAEVEPTVAEAPSVAAVEPAVAGAPPVAEVESAVAEAPPVAETPPVAGTPEPSVLREVDADDMLVPAPEAAELDQTPQDLANELARCQAMFMSYLEQRKLITIEVKKQIHAVEKINANS